jgi:hypothetical protein
MEKPNAATALHELLTDIPMPERPEFLRQLLAHTAAGLVIVEGGRKASEACYRVADAVAARFGCS